MTFSFLFFFITFSFLPNSLLNFNVTEFGSLLSVFYFIIFTAFLVTSTLLLETFIEASFFLALFGDDF